MATDRDRVEPDGAGDNLDPTSARLGEAGLRGHFGIEAAMDNEAAMDIPQKIDRGRLRQRALSGEAIDPFLDPDMRCPLLGQGTVLSGTPRSAASTSRGLVS